MWPLRLLVYEKGGDADKTLVGISGGSRLFLYCFLCRFGRETASYSFGEYAKQFRLTNNRVGQAIRELEARGVISISKEQGVDHRPKSLIVVDGDFADKLEASFENYSVEVDGGLIRDVAFGALRLEGSKGLTALNRLFLSVLLVHSSKTGMVDDLGQASLSKLTGFSVDQRRSQVSKLAELGFIRALVPGVTGRYLFGSTKSRYFLNMGHSGFGEYARSETLLVGRGFPGDEDYLGGQAEALFKGANEANRLISRIILRAGKTLADREYRDLLRVIRFEEKWGVTANVPDREFDSMEAELSGRLSEFFQDAPVEDYVPYLQVRINEYASQLIAVPKEQLQVRERVLREEIAQDLLRGKLSGELADFVSAILTASRVQASRARLLLDGVMQEIGPGGSVEAIGDVDFVILPILEADPEAGLIVTLCVSSKEETPITKHPYWDLRVTVALGGGLSLAEVSHYSDASFLEERMQVVCGVKAKAKRYPQKAV